MKTEMHNRSTWFLAQEIVTCGNSIERLSKRMSKLYRRNRIWRFIGARLYERRIKEFSIREGEASDELINRYAGVMDRLYLKIAQQTGTPTSPNALGGFIGSLWTSLLGEIGSDIGLVHLRFSVLHWELLERAARDAGADPQEPEFQQFKPMFMLRQFVDEMPSSDERGALRALVYFPKSDMELGRETIALLERAYAKLHDVVCEHAGQLDDLTGGAIPIPLVEQIEDPVPHYDRWLLVA